MPSKPGHITLNFNPIMLERLKGYAATHRMKINAVLKQAFELLEDQGQKIPIPPPKDDWDP